MDRYKRPYSSPWGKMERCKKKYDGVYEVSTCRHGGIMVHVEAANELLSKEAIKCGFLSDNRIFYYFEEDCQASVVIRELLDKGIWEIPDYFTEGAERYNEIINNSLEQWNPEYWEARGNELPLEALVKRLVERLNQNLHDYCAFMVEKNKQSSPEKIVLNATEIAAINDAFSYLTKEHTFNLPEVKYLLLFQNPLQVVADCWPKLSDLADGQRVLHDVFDKQDALNSGDYALITDYSADV